MSFTGEKAIEVLNKEREQGGLKMNYILKVKTYGKKPFWLKIPKLVRRKGGYIPLFISLGCFKGLRYLLK